MAHLTTPSARWPKEGTRDVSYNNGELQVGKKHYWQNSLERELPFVYLEALVLEEDPGRGDDTDRDPADALGFLSVMHTWDELLRKQNEDGSYESTFTRKLEVPVADKLEGMIPHLKNLNMVEGGSCTIEYTITVKLQK